MSHFSVNKMSSGIIIMIAIRSLYFSPGRAGSCVFFQSYLQFRKEQKKNQVCID